MEEQDRQEAQRSDRPAAPRLTGICTRALLHPRPQQSFLLQRATTSGLCNRLRGWAGIGALADIAGISFACYWQPQTQCDCRFFDVFVPDTCLALRGLGQRRRLHVAKSFRRHQAVRACKHYCTRFHLEEQTFIGACRARQRALKLRPRYADQLEAFMEQVPPGSIGVHVRRTDLLGVRRDLQRANRVLVRQLDRAIATNNDATFLLCADNPQSVYHLCKRYGDRIFWRQQHMSKRKLRRHRYTTQADAAIDLYALARTARLIGTRKSSFSLYAAQLGGIPFKLL